VAFGVAQIIRDDDRALRRWLLGAMALGFLALIAAGASAWSTTQRTQRFNQLVDHTHRVIQAIATFQIALEQSETARRGYLLQQQPLFLDTYRTNTATLQPLFQRVEELTRDNPAQVDAATRVRRLLADVQGARDRSIELAQTGRVRTATILFEQGGTVARMRAIRGRLRAMIATESALLEQRRVEQVTSTQTFLAILGGSGVLVMLVAALSLLTVLRFTRDLGQSRDRLRTLNDSLEDLVEDRTADLTRANEEIQRFAYIVSHDLRSPLVNVMGFTAEMEAGTKALAAMVERVEAEQPGLIDEDARLAAREDLPEAIGFIRTSTAKMDRLINAILKLSREGRRTLTPERLDMAAVVAAIRDTLQHRLDERGATITVEGALPAIVSDRLAVEQVFGNVLENAVKYLDATRPGRIVVRGRSEAGRAWFEVEDNGRGIDPRDHARVFDLFRRSGRQDQPGEGIGLAHVRALTYRLGGTIDVASELGRGATFRIMLPISIADAQGTSS
jgi:signal transduction histidine kinase